MFDEENKAAFVQFFDDVWAGRRDPDNDFGWINEILTAYPDLKATIDQVFAGENGRVVIIFTVTGTHQGNYRGIPADGKPFTFQGTTVARFEDGKIVDEFAVTTREGAVMMGQHLGQTEETGWQLP